MEVAWRSSETCGRRTVLAAWRSRRARWALQKIGPVAAVSDREVEGTSVARWPVWFRPAPRGSQRLDAQALVSDVATRRAAPIDTVFEARGTEESRRRIGQLEDREVADDVAYFAREQRFDRRSRHGLRGESVAAAEPAQRGRAVGEERAGRRPIPSERGLHEGIAAADLDVELREQAPARSRQEGMQRGSPRLGYDDRERRRRRASRDRAGEVMARSVGRGPEDPQERGVTLAAGNRARRAHADTEVREAPVRTPPRRRRRRRRDRTAPPTRRSRARRRRPSARRR